MNDKTVLTANDLNSGINVDSNTIFLKNDIFKDNCFKNSTGKDILDTFKWGANTYFTDRANKSNEQQARLALEIQNARILEEKIRLQQEKEKASSISPLKRYGLLIAIGGVVFIGSIGAYFYFKKKKI
jgi:hypothetical protein